jgi:sigma-B regulation protein RsbU (phosphoserine phosphatase)
MTESHNTSTTSVTERLRLAALDDVHLVDTPPEERFDRITRLAKQIFNVSLAQINLLGEFEQFTLSPQPGGVAMRRPAGESFCSTTILGPGLLVVPDATQDDRFADRDSVTGPHHIRFYAGRPLSLGDELRIGTLCLADTVPRALTPAELDVLEEMGTWVERELRDSRIVEEDADVDAAPTSIPNPPTRCCLPSRSQSRRPRSASPPPAFPCARWAATSSPGARSTVWWK